MSTVNLGNYFTAGAAGATGVVAGAAGAAGVAGAAGAAGLCCAGSPPMGAGFALGALPDMMEPPPPLPATKASDKEVSMKMIAALVVSLLMKVLPPPAPNTDWLPLAPKEAPISAPLPDCSKTTMINAKHTTMCSVTSRIVIKAVTSEAYSKSLFNTFAEKKQTLFTKTH